jgi:hypothetical protein
MNIATEIASVEKLVKASGLSVSRFLQNAGVDDAQWTRWKQGQIPLITTWAKIERAAARLRKQRA